MPTILHEDDDCLITYEGGNSDRCVVSFSGIYYGVGLSHWTGGLEPDLVYENPVDEFRKTLQSLEHIPHAYYITDKKRSWYNNTSFDTIHALIPQEIERAGYSDIYTIGNSMGGFGALIFSPIIPRVRRIIAFAPQSSIHPEIAPFEDRWSQYRAGITEWKTIDAVPLLGNIPCMVIYGAHDHRDRQHARRLSMTSPMFVEGASHPVAKFLRSKGVLYKFVQRLLEPEIVNNYPELLDQLSRTEPELVKISSL